jgi:hypothetical protein
MEKTPGEMKIVILSSSAESIVALGDGGRNSRESALSRRM